MSRFVARRKEIGNDKCASADKHRVTRRCIFHSGGKCAVNIIKGFPVEAFFFCLGGKLGTR